MAEGGYVKVRLHGGPYDGADRLVPEFYLEEERIRLPDPATVVNNVQTPFYDGPLLHYRLEEDGLGDLDGYYEP